MSGEPSDQFRSPRPAGRAYVGDLSTTSVGDACPLDPQQANHLVRARRLPDGAPVELFDDAGHRARGMLQVPPDAPAAVLVQEVFAPERQKSHALRLRIASAVPKGNRADWLVEKLSELGVEEWIPLRTRRAVVLPRDNKLERFARIARESAKQCERTGVMQISPLRDLEDVLADLESPGTHACVLSTRRPPRTLLGWIGGVQGAVTAFIGPEGDWDPAEEEAFAAREIAAVTLGPTILRVETAAVAAAVGVTLRHEQDAG